MNNARLWTTTPIDVLLEKILMAMGGDSKPCTDSVSSPPVEQKVDNRDERKGALWYTTSSQSPNASSISRHNFPGTTDAQDVKHGPPAASRRESSKPSAGTKCCKVIRQRPRTLDALQSFAYVSRSPTMSCGGVSAISRGTGHHEIKKSSKPEFSRARNAPITR